MHVLGCQKTVSTESTCSKVNNTGIKITLVESLTAILKSGICLLQSQNISLYLPDAAYHFALKPLLLFSASVIKLTFIVLPLDIITFPDVHAFPKSSAVFSVPSLNPKKSYLHSLSSNDASMISNIIFRLPGTAIYQTQS